MAAKGSITESESYYLYFLARILARRGSKELASSLDGLCSKCALIDAKPLYLPSGIAEVALPDGTKVVKANWRFLPHAENMSAEEFLRVLTEHFEAHTGQSISFEVARIRFALQLKYSQICIGLDELTGYYAFLLPNDTVLFECPVYGNAAYVVKGDWMVLSRQHKAQLKRRGTRIIHRQYWWSAIRSALRA